MLTGQSVSASSHQNYRAENALSSGALPLTTATIVLASFIRLTHCNACRKTASQPALGFTLSDSMQSHTSLVPKCSASGWNGEDSIPIVDLLALIEPHTCAGVAQATCPALLGEMGRFDRTIANFVINLSSSIPRKQSVLAKP